MADWKELNKLDSKQLAAIKYDDPRLDSFANAVEERYGLPTGLIEAVKNAGERSNTSQVSSKGAKGVMQFIDATRKLYPHNYNDPMESIDASGQFFRDLIKQYKGNVKAAVSHYNGGTTAGKAVLGGAEAPTAETRDYWKRLQSYMDAKHPAPNPTPTQPEKAPEGAIDKLKRVFSGELVSDVFGK